MASIIKISKEIKLTFLGAFLGTVGTAIYDYIKEKPLLSTFRNILKWVWVNIFEFDVKIWQIIIVLILIILCTVLYLEVSGKSGLANLKQNKWLLYTEDFFDGVKWKWGWNKHYSNGKYQIDNLRPVCKCGTAMFLSNDFYGNFRGTCPRCEYEFSKLKSIDKIEAVVLDNINRNLYQDKLPNQ